MTPSVLNRSLLRLLLCALCFMPFVASAARLGEARLASALGEPLAVSIDLDLAPGESLDRLRVSIAPPAQHEAFGIPYDFYLRSIDVRVEAGASGYSLELTSPRALDDFVLEFIVEVVTLRGSLLRAYSVLPEFAARRAGDAKAAADATAGPTTTDAARRAPPAASPGREGAAATRTPVALGSRYEVVSGDSLWSIASRMDAASGSLSQRLSALRAANPDIGDVRGLDVRDVLAIPDAEAVRLASTKNAVRASSPDARSGAGSPASTTPDDTGSGTREARARDVEALLRRARGRERVRLAAVQGASFERDASGRTTVIEGSAAIDPVEIERIRERLEALTQENERLTRTVAALQARPPVAGTEPAAEPASGAALPATEAPVENPPIVQSEPRPAPQTASRPADGGMSIVTLTSWIVALVLIVVALGLYLRQRTAAARLEEAERDEETLGFAAVPQDEDADGLDSPFDKRARFEVPASIDGRVVDMDKRQPATAKQAPKQAQTQTPTPMKDADLESTSGTVPGSIWSPKSILDAADDESDVRRAVARARAGRLDVDLDKPIELDPDEARAVADALGLDEDAESDDGDHPGLVIEYISEDQANEDASAGDDEDDNEEVFELELDLTDDEDVEIDLGSLAVVEVSTEDETSDLETRGLFDDSKAPGDQFELDALLDDDDLADDDGDVFGDADGDADDAEADSGIEILLEEDGDDAADLDALESWMSGGDGGADADGADASAPELAESGDSTNDDADADRGDAERGDAEREDAERGDADDPDAFLSVDFEEAEGPPLRLRPLQLLQADDSVHALMIAELEVAEGESDGELPDAGPVREALRAASDTELDARSVAMALDWFRTGRRSHPRGRLALRLGPRALEAPEFVTKLVADANARGIAADRLMILADVVDAAANEASTLDFVTRAREASLAFGLCDATPDDALAPLCKRIRPDVVRFARKGTDDELSEIADAVSALQKLSIATVVPTLGTGELQELLMGHASGLGPEFLEVAPKLLDVP